MKIRVVRNHNGTGTCGCTYDEGGIIGQALQSFGHQVQLTNPTAGLNGTPIDDAEFIVITTQPQKNNATVEDFVKRNPSVPLGWRPGHAQLSLVEKLMTSINLQVVHLCLEKAHALTGLMSVSDSALAINAAHPGTLVVVSNPSGASACRFGHFTEVLSIRVPGAESIDGKGAAFFGAFLGEWCHSGNLRLGLTQGHRFAAGMATGNWKRPGEFIRSLPCPAKALIT